MEKGSRGSSEGLFCELKTSALQKNVYQSTLPAISLNQHEILTAAQPQQGRTRHWEKWEEGVCLLASVVELIGKAWCGRGKSEDSQAQLLGNWWSGFNGCHPFWFERQSRQQPHTMVFCLKWVARLPAFILAESRLCEPTWSDFTEGRTQEVFLASAHVFPIIRKGSCFLWSPWASSVGVRLKSYAIWTVIAKMQLHSTLKHLKNILHGHMGHLLVSITRCSTNSLPQVLYLSC